MNQAVRPREFGLLHLRLPVGAVTSILHRVTGLLLIVLVGALIVLLRKALASPQGYMRVATILGGPAAHVLGPLAVWVVAQHTYAGLRHLALDGGLVQGRRAGRASAIAVLVVAAATAFAAALLWP